MSLLLPVSIFVSTRSDDVASERPLILKKTFPYAGSESSHTVRRSFSQRLLADLEIAKHIRNSNENATVAITSNKPCDMRDMQGKQFLERINSQTQVVVKSMNQYH